MDDKTILERERAYWAAHQDFVWLTKKDIEEVVGIIDGNVDQKGNALEICCGSGLFTNSINSRFSKYSCIDLSPALLKTLSQANPRVNIYCGDAENPGLSIGNELFDMVFCFAGLHHLPNLNLALQNIRNHIKKDGFFIGFEPNKDAIYRGILLPLKKFLKIYTEDEVFLSPAKLKSDLHEAGFREVKILYFSPNYYMRKGNTLANFFLAVYRSLKFILRGRLLSSFFIIIAR